MTLEAIDKALINRLQDGLPVVDRPFADMAADLDLAEEDVVARVERLLADGYLSRFGPMFQAERIGGSLSLVAMAVPDERFDAVAAQVNAHPEVAHNYRRAHRFNMWFVLATETPDEIAATLDRIEEETGLETLNLPKQQEFFVGLRLPL